MSGTRAKAIALLTGLQLAAGALAAQDAGIRGLFPARPTGFVTDVAGCVEDLVHDNENGFVVPPHSIIALTKAMSRIALDPRARRR